MPTDDGMIQDDGADEIIDTQITCKRCGKKGFHWEEYIHDVYRLYDADGNLHTCRKRG